MQGLLSKRIIFVFQMGKVGSQSVFRSIWRSLEKQNGRGNDCFLGRRGSKGTKKIGDTMVLYRHMLFFGSDLYNKLILWRVRLGLPIKIICPIREPIARDISAFFHFLYHSPPGAPAITDLKELEELFLKESTARPLLSENELMSEHEFPLNWFDEHFKPLTRIDVYKKPFPIDRKWQVYRRGFIWVLVYRNDLKWSQQAKLISRFLGIKLDDLRYTNLARNRDSAELYSRFHESAKLPEQYIRRMHGSRFAQHFWSPEELKVAADKWRVAPSS